MDFPRSYGYPSWAYRGLLPYTTTPTGHLRFYRTSIERRLAERHGPDDRR